MLRTRRHGIVAGALLAVVASMAGGSPVPASAGGAARLVDADGVVHFTNAPTDPRYRSLPGASGSGTGWLRLSDRSRRDHASDIQEISQRYGVSAKLVEAVVRTESAFDPAALSSKGAGGLMQLMPQTAAALGVVDRFDPGQSISGGVRHLRYLLDRYQGSVAMALAAYNAGEGPVDTYRGIPPYPETQQYVRRVLHAAGVSNPTESASRVLYRYVGPDDTVTYSNVPPVSKEAKVLRRLNP
jgi:soluble lytic murein transglycosylase-like protein